MKLIWNKCIVHILLAVACYFLWLIAALSGAAYLVRYRHSQGADTHTGSSSQAEFAYRKNIRYKLTVLYLLLGLLFLTSSITAGYYNSQIYWKSRLLWDTKIVLTVLIWLYYFIILAIVPITKLGEFKKREQLVSILAIIGALLPILNILLNRFSRLHNYL